MTVRRRKHFLREHSLSLVTAGILAGWVALYARSDPKTHWGSFFGNAIADWTGVIVMVIVTKYFYEAGSAESKRVSRRTPWHGHVRRFLRIHSLTIFLLITGCGWVWVYAHMKPEAKWGEVTGNIVSEWTQIVGLVLLTKRLRERRSKESSS